MGWKNLLVILGIAANLTFATDSDIIPLNQKQTGNSSREQEFKSTSKAGEAPEEKADPYVAVVEVYGTSRLDEMSLRSLLGKQFDEWLKKGLKNDPTATQLEMQLADKVKKKFDFAFAQWSVVQYFDADESGVFITLDTVEKPDVSRRMPFIPFPKDAPEFADPDNLIAEWKTYEKTAFKLVDAEKIEVDAEKPGTEACPALQCPFGYKHPELKPYKSKFVNGVKKHEKALVKILELDGRPDFRSSAVQLLSHLKDAKKIVGLMVARMKDPDEVVRNNALRLLGDIAELRRDIEIPLRPIVDALDYPRVTDRTKSAFVIYHILENSKGGREIILNDHVPTLLRMLASRQPDANELAHAILKLSSGKDFPRSNLKAWNDWYATFRSVVKRP